MTFDPTRRWYRPSLAELRAEELAWADHVMKKLWREWVREEAQSTQPTMTLYELLDAGDLFLRHPKRRWN